tara:strand:- start:851 stop:1378 length:528 start_codon:yes stop_codon:yes gene_type:complete
MSISIYALAGALAVAANPVSQLGLLTIAGLGGIVAGLGAALGSLFGGGNDEYEQLAHMLGLVSDSGGAAEQVKEMFDEMNDSIKTLDVDNLQKLNSLLYNMQMAGIFANPIMVIFDKLKTVLGDGGSDGPSTDKVYKVTLNLVDKEGRVKGSAETTSADWLADSFGKMIKSVSLF